MKAAIIGALNREVDLIKNALQNKAIQKIANICFYTGQIGKNTITVARCGAGKVSAALVTQICIDCFSPEILINTGCAGALNPKLKINDIVLGQELVEWDLDTTPAGDERSWIQELDMVRLPADKKIISMMENNISKNHNIYKGLIVSGDQFISSEKQKDEIFKHFPDALCVEMEGAAIAHVAVQNNIPFCVIRTISDSANSNSKIDYWEFTKTASEQSANTLIKLFSLI